MNQKRLARVEEFLRARMAEHRFMALAVAIVETNQQNLRPHLTMAVADVILGDD